MYALLSPASQSTIPAQRFAARYEGIAEEATMTGLTASIAAHAQRTLTNTVQVSFTVTIDTQMVGQFQVDNVLDLSHDGQRWAVDWTPKAIFPLLVWDNLVHLFVHVPSRGNIYDRHGMSVATEGKLIELGVVPGQIEDEASLLSVLGALLGEPPESIRDRYASAVRPDWFMPVGEITPELAQLNEALLSSVAGVTWREKAVRAYPQGTLAAHAIGYMSQIDEPTLAQRQAEGYGPDDWVGASGLEGWGEPYLSGRRGGTLAIISPEGRIVWTLAERQAEPARSIHTTLDIELQRATESILEQRVGSIVVLDVNSGDVLALVSYPRFDPGQLTAGATVEQWQALLNDPQRPFLNRAIAGVYPPGSAFKIVTLAAGMEELGLTEHRSYHCAGRWDGLADGATRHCWLRSGHGTLNLLNGLVHSCDTVFWEIGKALNELDPDVLPRYARAFGLGDVSGLNALDEAAGLIPDPAWKAQNYSGAEQQWLPRDAVNMAIGQGDVLVTPLQMANLASAVANGGTLYHPRLVRRITSPLGQEQEFPLETAGQLPLSAANLDIERRALEGVVTYGTASRAFLGATISMAGKSGTAEAPPQETHAWFAGYAPADNPQIGVAVVLEHGGEGGGDAAPLFRRVVEAFMAQSEGQ
jgi:penicillin-binding protein 2